MRCNHVVAECRGCGRSVDVASLKAENARLHGVAETARAERDVGLAFARLALAHSNDPYVVKKARETIAAICESALATTPATPGRLP